VRTEQEGKGDEGVKWTWREGKLPSTGTGGGGDSKTNDDDLAFSDSEDDEDDYIDELPTIKTRTQRTAVSSGVATDLTGFTPEIVPKTIEEREKILGILSANNMFSHITNDQRQIMADAMKPKECKDGDEVIRQGDAGESLSLSFFAVSLVLLFHSFTLALLVFYLLFFYFLLFLTFNIYFLLCVSCAFPFSVFSFFSFFSFFSLSIPTGDVFYILDTGIADVWVSKDSNEPTKVFTYEENSNACFGELALLYNAPRAATIKAKGDGTCSVLLFNELFLF